MVTFNYSKMQDNSRIMRREIGNTAKLNAQKHQLERKHSHCMYTPQETMLRIRAKAGSR